MVNIDINAINVKVIRFFMSIKIDQISNDSIDKNVYATFISSRTLLYY